LFLEILLKINKIGLNVWIKLAEYSALYQPWVKEILERTETYYTTGFVNTSIYNPMYMRPHGIYLDVHTQAFIILAALLIYISHIFNNQVSISKTQFYILSLGLILTTSTTYIFTGIFVALILYFIIHKNVFYRSNKKMIRKLFALLILVGSVIFIISPDSLLFYLAHKIGVGVEGAGVFNSLLKGTLNLPKDAYEIARNNLMTFTIGNGSSYKNVIGGEVHYLGELISFVGVIGTFMYLMPFTLPLVNGLKVLMRFKKNYSVTPYFMFSVFLPIVLFATLFHYSPVNYCTVFIMGMCLYTGYIDNNYLKYSRSS